MINGIHRGFSHYSWGNWIQSELGVESPLEIIMSETFDIFSRTGQLNVTIIGVDQITASDLKLRIALTESNLEFDAPNGTSIHNQVFRDMIPNTSGISLNIAEDDTLEFIEPFSIPEPLVVENCELVAFVQSDNDYSILQGAKLDIYGLSNLTSFSLIHPTDEIILNQEDVTFTWQSSHTQDSLQTTLYNIYIDDNDQFSNPIINIDLVDTSLILSDVLERSTNYYWRVLAYTSEGDWLYCNNNWEFYINGFPTIPTIISPENNIIADSSTMLVWLEASDPDSFDVITYAIQIDNDPSFSSPEIIQSGISPDVIVDDAISIQLLELDDYNSLDVGTKYYWRVRTDDSYGLSSDFTSGENCFYYINLQYLPGDANMSAGLWPPQVIGADVTFLVNYFRAMSVPCILDGFYAAGDANGDCLVIGSDVTYLVGYFRGGGSIIPYCPDYPTVWPTRDDLPVDAPTGWPNCE